MPELIQSLKTWDDKAAYINNQIGYTEGGEGPAQHAGYSELPKLVVDILDLKVKAVFGINQLRDLFTDVNMDIDMGGTIFLDEFSDLDIESMAKLEAKFVSIAQLVTDDNRKMISNQILSIYKDFRIAFRILDDKLDALKTGSKKGKFAKPTVTEDQHGYYIGTDVWRLSKTDDMFENVLAILEPIPSRRTPATNADEA